MMMRSKSPRLKTLGGICIAPSIFNINEPLVFGTPIVFNPLLMIPMWINSLVTPILIWVVMSLGWLAVPAASVTTGQIPASIGYIMVTGDFRAILFWALTFALTWAIWFPFFKVYERQVIAQEAEEAEAKLKEAKDSITEAHNGQTEVIQAEMRGEETKISLLFIHAQDTIMTITSEINMATEMLEMYKLIHGKGGQA